MATPETFRRWWQGVPQSVPPPDELNVVPMPRPTLDQRAARLRQLEQELMQIAIEIDRAALAFNAKRGTLLRERAELAAVLKEVGIKADFVHDVPMAPVSGEGDGDE